MTRQAIASPTAAVGSSASVSARRDDDVEPVVPIYLPSPTDVLDSFHPQLHFSSPPLSPPTTVRLLVSTLLIALSSLPICLTLNAAAVSTNPLSLFLVSVLILTCLVGLILVLWSALHSSSDPSSPTSSPPLFLPVFCLFCFSSLIDLWLCVSAYDLHPLASFYLVHGEAYLSSAHGAAINLWDGTFHLTCYLTFVASISRGWDYYSLSLVWCGSILNSMIVLLMGAVVGYGGHLQWSMLLNVPYVVLPSLMAYRRWQQRHVVHRAAAVAAWRPTVWDGVMATLVVTLTVGMHGLRVCAALSSLLSKAGLRRGSTLDWSSSWLEVYAQQVEPSMLSPSAFPLLQHVLFLFAYTPLLLAVLPYFWPSAVKLSTSSPEPSAPSPALSAALRYALYLHIGAILQGHCTYWMQALLPYTVKSHWVDSSGQRWGMGPVEGLAFSAVEMAIVGGNLWLTWRLTGGSWWPMQRSSSSSLGRGKVE